MARLKQSFLYFFQEGFDQNVVEFLTRDEHIKRNAKVTDALSKLITLHGKSDRAAFWLKYPIDSGSRHKTRSTTWRSAVAKNNSLVVSNDGQ